MSRFGEVEIIDPVDSTTGALKIIDYAHKEIHSGDHFYIEGNTVLGDGGTLFIKLVTPDNARWGHFIWELNSSGILTATLDEDAVGGMAAGLRPTIHANNRNVHCWTGLHTGGVGAAVLTDITKAWAIGELIGYQVFNTLDGSSAIITANTATTVTAALAGGANLWNPGFTYEINKSGFVIDSGVTTCAGYIQRVANRSFGSKGSYGAISRENELIIKQNTIYCRSFTSGTAGNVIGFKASWYEHINH